MRTIALISLFRVVVEKKAKVIDEVAMSRVIGKNLAIIMEKV